MVTTEQVRQQYFDAFSTQISAHLRPMLFVEFDYEETVEIVREWHFNVGFRSTDPQQRSVIMGFIVRPEWPIDTKMTKVIYRNLESAWTRHNGPLPDQIDP